MINGRAWLFEDNISTDAIIPGRLLSKSGVIPDEQWGELCFIDCKPNFVKDVRKGDIMIAGKNFGCGSSREMAALSIKHAGIACIIAESFARIFYRNCINIGLPLLNAGQALLPFISLFDNVSLNIFTGELYNQSKSKTLYIEPIQGFIKEVLDCGGLMKYAQENDHLLNSKR